VSLGKCAVFDGSKNRNAKINEDKIMTEREREELKNCV